MTKDRVSRRKVLGATAIAGSLGFASGASVRSVLGDRTEFADNAATGGTLDLLVDAAADVDPGAWSPSLSPHDTGSSVRMDEACGTAGLAVAVCGNPGTVTLATAGDEDDDGPPTADEPFVTVFTGDCADGHVLTAGWLSTVREDLAGGVPLHPASSHLGTIDADDVVDGTEVTFDHGGETVVVGIEAVEAGGEPVGVDLTVDGAGLSQVSVKGGGHPLPDPCEIPAWVAAPGDCTAGNRAGNPAGGRNGPPGRGTDSAGRAPNGRPGRAPNGRTGRSPNGRRIGVAPYFFDRATDVTGLRTRDDTAISHIDLYACEKRCFDCEVDPPFPVYLSWTGASSERTLDLALEAVQCRHVAAGGDR